MAVPNRRISNKELQNYEVSVVDLGSSKLPTIAATNFRTVLACAIFMGILRAGFGRIQSRNV